MKTIREWFETFPEPWRTQALANMDAEFSDYPVENKSDAVNLGISWSSAAEKPPHWRAFHRSLLEKESAKHPIYQDSEQFAQEHGTDLPTPKSLRDEFAMAALTGMFSNPSMVDNFTAHPVMAQEAYNVADAMLAARNSAP